MTTTAARPALAADLDQRVDEVLRAVTAQARLHAAHFGPDYVHLWSEVERSVRGGKRFRSRLVLGTHDALGGRRPQDAVRVAAGFELLHTAFLIHDDLIDRDTVRRGEPNLAATMRARAVDGGAEPERAQRWSEAAAVLAGDLALSRAHRLVADVDLPLEGRRALLDLLDRTLLISAGGELEDTAYGLGLGEPDLPGALLVCESKTAMYSFRAPLQAGAILAGAGPDVVGALDGMGRLLGRAFQLVDDLLGVFAPEDVIGKSNLSDLREGKVTALVLHARELPVWVQVADDVGREDLDQRDAGRVRRLLAGSDAPGLVAAHVREDLARVRGALDEVPAGLGPVVCGVALQVEGALDDALGFVADAR